MRKLIKSREKNKFYPYREVWLLKNNLEIYVYFEDVKNAISIAHSSGSVTEQIYEILKNIEGIELGGIGAPVILVDKALTETIFDHIEAIDPKKLKPGVIY